MSESLKTKQLLINLFDHPNEFYDGEQYLYCLDSRPIILAIRKYEYVGITYTVSYDYEVKMTKIEVKLTNVPVKEVLKYYLDLLSITPELINY